ncbi:C40 family peptidase [Actinacidiphila yeochonensis]|uniref:C40 family peptidase n=1 Tax=Actinacidiphila yeochonensis TaxID=89050 RepID=UPI00055E655F|nr:C40 family peptidase [Actinacidiphila yeochonensis]
MASHRRIPRRGPAGTGTRAAVLSAAAAAAALSAAAPLAVAADGGPEHGPRGAASRLDRLYQEAEQATQGFDATRERAGVLRDELADLQDQAARDQQRVNDLRDRLGLLAAAQYRAGALDPTLALLLSPRPEQYLDQSAVLDRIGADESARLTPLREAERALAQQRAQASGKLAELRATTATLQRRKQAVQSALSAARALLRGMTPGQRDAFGGGFGDRASRDAGLFPLGDLPASSARAALAVAAARSALGSPYLWGATGPRAFDCSGLMQWSYARAGVALPRTSQEQMNAGRRVPLNEIRPGDLVVYRSDASHVGMYVGGGRVIHAPYPGARVRFDPVGMMPIAAVTRP